MNILNILKSAALYWNLILSFLIFSTYEFYKIKKNKKEFLIFIFTWSAATLIIGIGFFLQNLIEKIIWENDFYSNFIYSVEFYTNNFITSSFMMIISGGILPALLCTIILINFKYLQTIFGAGISGIAALAAADTINYTFLYFIFNQLFEQKQIYLSLVCNFIGGPIAGIVTLWLIHENSSLLIKGAAPLLKGATTYLACCIVSIIAICGAYFIFLHPMSEYFVLNITSLNSAFVDYDEDKETREINDKIKFASIGDYEFQIPLDGLYLYQSTSEGFQFKNDPKSKSPTSNKIKLKIAAVLGCASEQLALKKALESKYILKKEIEKFNLSFIGNRQEMKIFFGDKETSSTIRIPLNTLAWFTSDDKDISGKLGTLLSIYESTLKIPILKGEVIILSALPQIMTYLDTHEELPTHSAELGGVELRFEESKKTEFLYIETNFTELGCRAVPFLNSYSVKDKPLSIKYEPSHRFVLWVEDVENNSTAELNLQNTALKIPNLIEKISSSETKTNVFSATVISGDLSVGTERYPLSKFDNVKVYGKLFSKNANGEILTLSGTTNFIRINNRIVSKTAWEAIDSNLKALLVAFIIGLGVLFRKHIARLIWLRIKDL